MSLFPSPFPFVHYFFQQNLEHTFISRLYKLVPARQGLYQLFSFFKENIAGESTSYAKGLATSHLGSREQICSVGAGLPWDACHTARLSQPNGPHHYVLRTLA